MGVRAPPPLNPAWIRPPRRPGLGNANGIQKEVKYVRIYLYNKKYIGKTTKTIEQRFKEHLKDCKKRREEQRPLYNAMNYYGIEHFWIEELEKINVEDLEDREIYWINYYNSYKNGYNATIGGDGKILYDYNEIIELYKQGFLQKETVDYCHEKGILVEAWSPLGRGKSLTHPLLEELASKYGRTVAQIILRWEIQHDIVPLPKSVNENRIIENANVFDFELSEDDMSAIDEIEPYGNSGHSPDQA